MLHMRVNKEPDLHFQNPDVLGVAESHSTSQDFENASQVPCNLRREATIRLLYIERVTMIAKILMLGCTKRKKDDQTVFSVGALNSKILRVCSLRVQFCM